MLRAKFGRIKIRANLLQQFDNDFGHFDNMPKIFVKYPTAYYVMRFSKRFFLLYKKDVCIELGGDFEPKDWTTADKQQKISR